MIRFLQWKRGKGKGEGSYWHFRLLSIHILGGHSCRHVLLTYRRTKFFLQGF